MPEHLDLKRKKKVVTIKRVPENPKICDDSNTSETPPKQVFSDNGTQLNLIPGYKSFMP